MGISKQKDVVSSPIDFYFTLKSGGVHAKSFEVTPRGGTKDDTIFIDHSKFKIAVVDIKSVITGFKEYNVGGNIVKQKIFSNRLTRPELVSGVPFIVRTKTETLEEGSYKSIKSKLASHKAQFGNEIVFYFKKSGLPYAVGSLIVKGANLAGWIDSSFTVADYQGFWIGVSGFDAKQNDAVSYHRPKFSCLSKLSSDESALRCKVEGLWDEYLESLSTKLVVADADADADTDVYEVDADGLSDDADVESSSVVSTDADTSTTDGGTGFADIGDSVSDDVPFPESDEDDSLF